MKWNETLLVILILAVIGLIVYSIVTYYKRIQENIARIKMTNRIDLRELRLAEEERNRLLRKANSIYKLILVSFFLMLLGSIGMAIFYGMGYSDSLEVILATAMFVIAVFTVTRYSTWNPDVLLEKLNGSVVRLVFKRYGFKENRIRQLRVKIQENNDTINHLELLLH